MDHLSVNIGIAINSVVFLDNNRNLCGISELNISTM